MYTIDAAITGTAPLMQHRYPMPDLDGPAKRVTGKVDYLQEWRDYLYVLPDGTLYQPATHVEAAMTKAAASFKVPGRRGATYKDLVRAALIVTPDAIPHAVAAPAPDAQLTTDTAQPLYIDARPVVVQKARVVRVRPVLRTGWEISFTIQVTDDQLPADVVNDILVHAGRSVGIGDFRPRFGRFLVSQFTMNR